MASTNPQSAVSVTSVDLSVIIPTYNESGNVAELINKIAIALQECRWEIIFVDDDCAGPRMNESQLPIYVVDKDRIERLGLKNL